MLRFINKCSEEYEYLATESLLLDTQHQESWNQIQDIENRRPEEPIYFEPEKMPPRFVVPLPAQIGEFNEGEPIHLEGQVSFIKIYF